MVGVVTVILLVCWVMLSHEDDAVANCYPVDPLLTPRPGTLLPLFGPFPDHRQNPESAESAADWPGRHDGARSVTDLVMMTRRQQPDALAHPWTMNGGKTGGSQLRRHC